MANESATIVKRVKNYANVLRDDGVSSGDYVEQINKDSESSSVSQELDDADVEGISEVDIKNVVWLEPEGITVSQFYQQQNDLFSYYNKTDHFLVKSNPFYFKNYYKLENIQIKRANPGEHL